MLKSNLPEKLKKGREAALEFLPILKAKLASPDGSLHAGTMLSTAAWLAGTSLHRSFEFKEENPPGTVIKSDEVNREWESLMVLLEEYNFQRRDIPVGRLMLTARAVMKKHGSDYLDRARTGIVLCSILIQQYNTARIIDPYAAAGIVAQRVLEAAKTVPPPLKSIN